MLRGSLVLLLALTGCSAAPTVVDDPSPKVERRTSLDPARGPESNGAPRRALLTIPRLGIRDLPAVPYRGWTDDAPGTVIQDRGVAASPFGPDGGVGPGGIGNYQVTAHRTSSTRAFANLPQLRRGDRVYVVAAGVRYVYEITTTRSTSFRSARSLAEQRAAVPGKPGAPATKAFLTLSTCATPEDHAAGNYWSDEFHNPEHRIDKIGVLVSSRPVPARG
ncbi:MAG TPA: sortase [Nocardioidaceae bacterium]|nr:sortase [Nocardioidaceae bacterium]